MKKEKYTMKENFKGFSDYSNEEYKEIWDTAIIVIDTNILLNFYRYSTSTRTELYKVLESLKDRLWIPYQVAFEYFKNKENVIENTYKDFEKLKKDIDKDIEDIIEKIENKPQKQLKCREELVKTTKKFKGELITEIEKEENNRKNEASEENIERLIFDLFNESVGPEIVGKEFLEMKEEGNRRKKEKIPPGYKDSDKDENGDYYIFYSIKKVAKERQKNVIFVTDDVKEDWFVRSLGKIKCGDYRLLNEFFKETGKLLLIYTSDGFLKQYENNVETKGKISINKDVIIELEKTKYFDEKYENNRKIYKKLRWIRNRIVHDDYEKKDAIAMIESLKNELEISGNIDYTIKKILENLYLSYINENKEQRMFAIYRLSRHLTMKEREDEIKRKNELFNEE